MWTDSIELSSRIRVPHVLFLFLMWASFVARHDDRFFVNEPVLGNQVRLTFVVVGVLRGCDMIFLFFSRFNFANRCFNLIVLGCFCRL